MREEIDASSLDVILEQAGRFAADVLCPLNRVGDREGARLDNGNVVMPTGFNEAYAKFVEGGWNGLVFPERWGGQGLPWVLNAAVTEIWNGANLAFQLCPLLSQAAAETLLHHGSKKQQDLYARKLVHGTWTGAMCLTEPQAGSDLSNLKCRAEPREGHYGIFGQKIYITYGDHDLTENIVHLVLARLPDAPAGSRGISLFLVPKFLPNDDGSVGAPNDVSCTTLEHKLGIRGSPTCVMEFGRQHGAVGFLVGEENAGMRCMFTMMNNARIAVGVEGLGIAERAYQLARSYAQDRVQGRIGDRTVAIEEHADVCRMLLTMQASIAAMRALCYVSCASIDAAKATQLAEARGRAENRTALLTPITKAWCTDRACEVTSLAIQVMGGIGYIEGTGAAQLYRDARILPIYEGTNGIQALDLVGRKLTMNDGRLPWELFEDLRDKCAEPALLGALSKLESATKTLQSIPVEDREVVAVSYLELFGAVLAAFHLATASTLDASRTEVFHFYCRRLLPRALAEADVISDVASLSTHVDRDVARSRQG